ncbi:MAG: WYL domain-containing protein [Clostridiaceae bacterium]|nr:WYL domain-containing protein [Clostridiaceae bacterium]
MAFEPKKLALLRIWQILKDYSDYDHPLTQEQIAEHLESDYGIEIERKAIGRNISLLKDAGIDIQQKRDGSYIESREFDDSELRLLIDGVLCSKYISANYSKQLIDKLCGLSNVYFRSHVKHIFSVNDWGKTENKALFFNIELIDVAINEKKRLHYDYNKYGIDKKLHKTSQQNVSPYLMIVHNQRYYLMAYSEFHGNIVFHRLDRMTNMTLLDEKPTPLRSLKGYKNGIDYKQLSSAMPYLYPDEIKSVKFKADAGIIDQIIDWFGKDAEIKDNGDETVTVSVKASPGAMEHWAMQYINHVEVLEPKELREAIKADLKAAEKKYR